LTEILDDVDTGTYNYGELNITKVTSLDLSVRK